VFLVFHTIPSDAFFDGSYASKCRWWGCLEGLY
jgi:hypothetical protein